MYCLSRPRKYTTVCWDGRCGVCIAKMPRKKLACCEIHECHVACVESLMVVTVIISGDDFGKSKYAV